MQILETSSIMYIAFDARYTLSFRTCAEGRFQKGHSKYIDRGHSYFTHVQRKKL